jgi:hypothetical protein
LNLRRCSRPHHQICISHRARNVSATPPSVIQAEMEAVVFDGRIQSVSPTSLPFPRAGGRATTSVQAPSVTAPLLGLLALGLAGLASGAVVLLRHWMGARPIVQPERASRHCCIDCGRRNRRSRVPATPSRGTATPPSVSQESVLSHRLSPMLFVKRQRREEPWLHPAYVLGRAGTGSQA